MSEAATDCLFEQKLIHYINEQKIDGEHLHFEQSCHSIKEAAEAAQAAPSDFVKNVCMIDEDSRLIVAIVKGEDNASSKRVAKALNINRPRLASPEEILEKTGFPCGGTPSFGYEAIFIVDPKVLESTFIFTGGGSECSLVKISPESMLKANQALIERVRR